MADVWRDVVKGQIQINQKGELRLLNKQAISILPYKEIFHSSISHQKDANDKLFISYETSDGRAEIVP